MQLLIGADPEVFVQQYGKFVSGFGLIEGTKQNPFKVDKGAVQVDGMALEFNIDPAASEGEFVHNVQHVMEQLALMVPKHNLVIVPVAHFGKKVFSEQPEEALELGCDPDFNAYTGNVNPKPNGNKPFRTAAGHIHIGWTKDMDVEDPGHIEACQMLTRQLDYFLGIPSVLFDSNKQRRDMYGKAGCYRVKPYGVEYRVLSNAWLKSPERISWVYKTTKKAFDYLMDGLDYYEKYGKSAESVINLSRVEKARDLVYQLQLEGVA